MFYRTEDHVAPICGDQTAKDGEGPRHSIARGKSHPEEEATHERDEQACKDHGDPLTSQMPSQGLAKPDVVVDEIDDGLCIGLTAAPTSETLGQLDRTVRAQAPHARLADSHRWYARMVEAVHVDDPLSRVEQVRGRYRRQTGLRSVRVSFLVLRLKHSKDRFSVQSTNMKAARNVAPSRTGGAQPRS